MARVGAVALAVLAVGAGVAGATDGKQDPRAGKDGADLRSGAVFTMTNARKANEVVAFARAADGRLRRVGAFPTGGQGSGSFEDSNNGLILGSSEGESAPNNHAEDGDLLFATNPRSDSITVFRVLRDRLRRVEVEPSGGVKPVSVTVSRGVLYVLNSGEATDDLFDSEGNVIPNCTTGTPSITGFRVSTDGELTPIAGSTRRLSGLGGSGCAQVSFNPRGDVLVVSERLANDEDAPGPEGDEGALVSYTRNADGTLGAPRVTDATGEGPFGFAFNKGGDLFVSEQFDGPLGPGRGGASAYRVGADGSLTPSSPSVPNGGTDTCWVVITDDGRYAYMTSFFADGRLSVYGVSPGGGLRLIEADASAAVDTGASDISLSRDSRYLYQLNSMKGTINAFRVSADGSVSLVQTVTATGPSPMAGRIGLAAS